jgi:RNA polymerase sigma-70 factor (ECF subfamily)
MAAATIPAIGGRAKTPWKLLPPARRRLFAQQSPPQRRTGLESVHDSFSQQEVRPVTRKPPQQPGQEAGRALDSEAAAFSAKSAAVLAEQQALNQLAMRCVAGDGAAWEQLARTQHRRVYGICYRFTGSPSDAEDLTQDIFFKMYRNLASFDPAKGGFTTWLTTLTRNLLVDNYRRSRLERASDSLDEPVGSGQSGEEGGATKADRLVDGGRTQEQHVAGLELRAQIQAALKQVSPELREAVILRDLEDMDYKEIAEVLGVPQGTVKSRISRGRAELARLLKRIEGQVM